MALGREVGEGREEAAVVLRVVEDRFDLVGEVRSPVLGVDDDLVVPQSLVLDLMLRDPTERDRAAPRKWKSPLEAYRSQLAAGTIRHSTALPTKIYMKASGNGFCAALANVSRTRPSLRSL